MLIRLFQQTTIGWGLGLKRQVRKVQRIPDAVVRGRSTCGSEAKESLEGGHGLLSAIVPKDELVEVGLELRAAYPVMSADEPLLEVADGAVGEWRHRWRALAQFGSQRLSARDVLEAEFLQASKAFEAVGMNGREPGATFCVMKLLIVVALKSGMTAIRVRPEALPRFSTATTTSAARRPLSWRLPRSPAWVPPTQVSSISTSP